MFLDVSEVRPIADPVERSRRLQKFLDVLERHPGLAHFRAAVPAERRELALFAALERHAHVGPPARVSPADDDQADQLLCDILDTLDSVKTTADMGMAYGPDQRRSNLQMLGAWDVRPAARELFTTLFSSLTADEAYALVPSSTLNSPPSQDVAPNGELSEASAALVSDRAALPAAAQAEAGTLVVTPALELVAAAADAPSGALTHHAARQAGELTESVAEELSRVPARSVRRRRPRMLDDLAKGRLLGLMAHGLSFRQAAAQLGVHHTAILHLMKRDEQFAQQVAEARHEALMQPLLTVIRASRTSWRAAAWLARFLDERRASEEREA